MYAVVVVLIHQTIKGCMHGIVGYIASLRSQTEAPAYYHILQPRLPCIPNKKPIYDWIIRVSMTLLSVQFQFVKTPMAIIQQGPLESIRRPSIVYLRMCHSGTRL